MDINFHPVYYIRKYADCWAVHDDDTSASRPLAPDEAEAMQKEFPALANPNVRTVFTDTINTINLSIPLCERIGP